MKIRDILAEGRPTLSFEVFPPKTQDKYESVEKAAFAIAALKPDFMSVTYGAGGGPVSIRCRLRQILRSVTAFPLWLILPVFLPPERRFIRSWKS